MGCVTHFRNIKLLIPKPLPVHFCLGFELLIKHLLKKKVGMEVHNNPVQNIPKQFSLQCI
jgi:hypothetical protein